jgi:ribose transport system permease protein
MKRNPLASLWPLLLRDYATLLALLMLCGVLSAITLAEQHPTGAAAGRQVAAILRAELPRSAGVLIVVQNTQEDRELAAELSAAIEQSGLRLVAVVQGEPFDARRALQAAVEGDQSVDVIAATDVTGRWPVFDRLGEKYPPLADTRVVHARSYVWPNFLKASNLLNIANQIALIAIVAIGMTMVIIGGGIDLSVGSLIALSAVVTARLIRDIAGGTGASAGGMAACSLLAIGSCTTIGLVTGTLVAYLRIPPFIVTLAVMLAGSGLASIVSDAQTINEVPESINWLGGGADLFRIPNAVVLMALLYAAAHVVMARTTFGRHLYAVGGNEKAAWLCGISVPAIRMATYAISASLAGLGGVLMTSTFESGGPTYGAGYELRVIAAVVVGGTSLAGGEGKMLGTLLGALLIAVAQNGMNLMGVSSDWQNVVLGTVVLVAALLDRAKAAWLPR